MPLLSYCRQRSRQLSAQVDPYSICIHPLTPEVRNRITLNRPPQPGKVSGATSLFSLPPSGYTHPMPSRNTAAPSLFSDAPASKPAANLREIQLDQRPLRRRRPRKPRPRRLWSPHPGRPRHSPRRTQRIPRHAHQQLRRILRPPRLPPVRPRPPPPPPPRRLRLRANGQADPGQVQGQLPRPQTPLAGGPKPHRQTRSLRDLPRPPPQKQGRRPPRQRSHGPGNETYPTPPANPPQRPSKPIPTPPSPTPHPTPTPKPTPCSAASPGTASSTSSATPPSPTASSSKSSANKAIHFQADALEWFVYSML